MPKLSMGKGPKRSDGGWTQWRDLADDMLMDSTYNFASDTVQSIRDWIAEHEHVTPGQIRALTNIKGSGGDWGDPEDYWVDPH